mmetsp:Transcript_39568/g.85660  ORF Transcript_39568/g.85660 Transcript_39568/m.85660 type:complete len:258 (-) Transcript_39568:48-821(-)
MARREGLMAAKGDDLARGWLGGKPASCPKVRLDSARWNPPRRLWAGCMGLLAVGSWEAVVLSAMPERALSSRTNCRATPAPICFGDVAAEGASSSDAELGLESRSGRCRSCTGACGGAGGGAASFSDDAALPKEGSRLTGRRAASVTPSSQMELRDPSRDTIWGEDRVSRPLGAGGGLLSGEVDLSLAGSRVCGATLRCALACRRALHTYLRRRGLGWSGSLGEEGVEGSMAWRKRASMAARRRNVSSRLGKTRKTS